MKSFIVQKYAITIFEVWFQSFWANDIIEISMKI